MNDPCSFLPKENDKEIITPSKLDLGNIIQLPSNKLLVVFTSGCFRDCEELINVEKTFGYSIKTVCGEFKGTNICCSHLHAGAPVAVLDLEILIHLGAKYIIAVGEAGAIKEGLEIGDIVLPTWGIREEGTSYHYAHPEYTPKPSRKLLSLIKEELSMISVDFSEGGVWSTDAPFRETVGKVKKYSEMGVLSVDMESTALMTVAQYRGVELAVILVVSDKLYTEEWIHGFGTPALREKERVTVQAALSALKRLG